MAVVISSDSTSESDDIFLTQVFLDMSKGDKLSVRLPSRAKFIQGHLQALKVPPGRCRVHSKEILSVP